MGWMGRGSGIFGGMGVRRESEFFFYFKITGLLELFVTEVLDLTVLKLNLLLKVLIYLIRTLQDLTLRLDSLIDEIHAIQSPNMRGESPCDVLLVAHGHLLRAFVKRWLKYPLDFPLSMLMLEPGGVGILSYEEHDINQPAFCLGIGFPLAKTS